MNWHYVANGEQKGPVDQAEFDRLIQTGTISSETLVWCEGMTDWRSHGEVIAASAPSAATASARPAVVCSECGRAFSLDETVRIGSGYVCGNCKGVAMQKLREGVADNDFERIRREHIKHEASVKSIGSLYFLGSFFVILYALGVFFAGFFWAAIIGAVLLLIAGLQIWVGIGLVRLKSWARIPTGILSGIGLLAFPLGTLINAYILYLVFCKKGATVFSDDYKRVVEATPHIKYKTSIIVWIALAILLLLFGLAFFAVLFGGRR